ncbi:hypothetical protein D5018_19620 [Parashewanella curva]|uniref:Uncharacterized protein n=1 Tax=Parashewanella curva TaxID=2338552 RepID=A0A3L8PRG6_9GAMM|nr:hypothetical protein [Parashewanella curva]RLV57991.1 hypothetical protein D5018_19620 [Parashewanella curva]
MSLSRVKISKRKIKNVKARRDVKRKRAKKMQSNMDARWKEHQKYIESRKTEQWILDAKKSFDWFLEIMGESEWDKRKKSVVAYFKKQQMSFFPEEGKKREELSESEKRIAYHQDWIAWYMYLVESLYHRPYVNEASQSCRIYPFFCAFGRHIDMVKSISGIDAKLIELLRGKNNQPDSILFEISVALMYARNGWDVSFIPETADKKTPDILVEKDGNQFFVECKRQAKVTEYSETERKEWNRRWDILVQAMAAFKIPTFMDVTFKVEVAETPLTILASAFAEIARNEMISSGYTLENDQVSVSVDFINMPAVNKHFEDFQVSWNSPQMVALFAGDYERNGSYTQVHSPKGVNAVGPDDEEHILNLFCTGVYSAYCAKWECLSDTAIDKKAKDVRKLLGKAIDQAPDEGNTIVHIAYETLHGPLVEFERHKKIANSINSFDYKSKNVKAVFCHALQPSVGPEESEWAETTMRFGRDGIDLAKILPNDLLLDESATKIANETHWYQDLNSMVTGA